MAHVARGRINIFLQRLGLNLECAREVFTNGHCFYDSIVAVAEDPRIRSTLSQDAQHILAGRSTLSKDARHIVRDFRIALANFMGTNVILHGLMWFEEYRRATLADKRNKGKTWRKYLQEVAHTNEYADQLQVMCMALFCGKDIWQVSEESLPDNPWVVIPGQAEGWPFPARGPPIKLAYSHKGEHYEPLKHLSVTPLLADVIPPSVQPQTEQDRPTAATYASVASGNRINQAAKRKSESSQSVLPSQIKSAKISPKVTTKQAPSFENISMSKAKAAPEERPTLHTKVSSATSSKVASAPQEISKLSKPQTNVKEVSCKGCNWNGKSLNGHFRYSPSCKDSYNMEVQKEEAKILQKEKWRSASKERYNDPEKREAQKESSRRNYGNPEKRAAKIHASKEASKKNYNDPEKRQAKKEAAKRASQQNYEKPDKRDAKKKAVKKRYHENKENILAVRAEQRMLKFMKKTEKDRFMDFHEEMKNVCGFGCICCHRILVNTRHNKVKGGFEGLKKLLDDKNPGLFKNCILDKDLLPKGLFNGSEIYLCCTCERWLTQLKDMPPMCYNNGLGIDPIPAELKDLNDLEATLIAKQIIFLKIFKMPISRWHMNKDKSVLVPLDDDVILENMNSVTSLPRRPDEAGLIPVDLKRKKDYKNNHLCSYVQPAKLVKAVTKLKELKHRAYANIKIENRYSVLADELSESDDSEDEGEDEVMDCIRRNQLDMGASTTLTNVFPEASVVTNLPKPGSREESKDQPRVAVAPGEGKIPTSLTQNLNWVVEAFPQLFPTGRFGLDHPRKKKLSTQQYFCQRFQNIDKRFGMNAAFLFAALFHIEKQSLENALSVSYRRGKIVNGKLTNLEDPCCVFDNQPGSFRYWMKRRHEVIAKLEQLGPFQIFFTLSCADKRWDENFVALLQQSGLKIVYEPAKQEEQGTNGKYSYKKDNIFVQDGDEKIPLRQFLEKADLPELVRKNILTITMIFDKRVHAFMNKIVMAPSSPFNTKYYHYRVEFQKRGAGHIHGVLWLDLKAVEEANDRELDGLQDAMNTLKASKRLNLKQEEVVAKFVDRFVTCSLDDDNLSETVQEVQEHTHKGNIEKRTGCYKKGPNCRFKFPRMPSEKTLIAQPLEKGQMSDKEFASKKKVYRETIQKVKEILENLTKEELDQITIDEVLNRAKVQKDQYYEALKVSQTGSCVVLKRKPKEMNINNYNAEWMKAWDGNMDISVCLDFFAIITYITDYYTKSETDMMKQITAAAKACKDRGDDMKVQMRHLINTFLTSRQMGESEAYYRMFPYLHLSESNVKCVFVATGFPENRSNMLRPMRDKLADEDFDNVGTPQDGIEIEGSDKTYKRVTPIHEKYASRPEYLNKMCLAQFAISYDMMPNREGSRKKYLKGASEEVSTNPDMQLASYNPDHEKGLPKWIKLSDNLGYMRLRKYRSILRLHKLREDKNPHEYYYSQLLLFSPWTKEKEDLAHGSAEDCLRLFQMRANENEVMTNIEKTQDKLFPYMNSVQEGRVVVAHFDDKRPTHVGDEMDPENEAENEEAEMQGFEESLEHAGRIPDDDNPKFDDAATKHSDGKYKQIPIPRDETQLSKLRAAARSLDDDQRMAFDIVLKLVRQKRAAGLGQRIDPIFLKVHGGAGCGKSHLINTMTEMCEYNLRINNKELSDPTKPAIMKLAPTGQASTGIDGLTLHSAFNLPFGNQYVSLSDKLRETARHALSNLTIVVIDEMSMVKADLLYQLHMRLQEIKQNKMDFGGVSIILCGDLLQLPPVMAAQIFEAPRGEKFREFHEICPLWDQFDAIELKTNHRQGKDKEYGDLLNRLRKNQHTEEDLKQLASKVGNSSPEGAVYIYGRNAPANEKNEHELAKLKGKQESMTAIHLGKTRNFKPWISKGGFVNRTPFLEELKLKIGARVMLRYNVDTADRLTNGACGVVMGFEWSRGNKPEIKKVLIQFDDEKAGKKRRTMEHPELTAISRVSFEYTLGKRKKDHAATAKVVQFPITLAWAITAHKCQGMTIKAPTMLVADLDSCWAPGMAYVMLGRVQNVNQLIIRWSYSPTPSSNTKEEKKRLKDNTAAVKRLKVNDQALEEAEKISQKALNNIVNENHDWLHSKFLKITSLNIQGSLTSRLPDLQRDKMIHGTSDIICLQEIGNAQELPALEGYTCCTVGDGKNKGVAIFVKNEIAKDLRKPQTLNNDSFQGLKVSFHQFELITIYRSPDQNVQGSSFQQFTDTIAKAIDDPNKPFVLCGDFNFDQKKENSVTRMLSEKGFKQIVKEPTTYRGSCIDHVYHNIPVLQGKVTYKLHYPYFSDHEAVCVMIQDY